MHQLKSAVVGLSVLLGLGVGAASLAAQSWQGSLALGLEVRNDQKQPVPGARVTAEFAEVEPYDGPEAVTTDPSGRAVLYGLAEGLWRVQVEREGYSRYLAVVRLDAKKKKVVVTAGPLRDATAPPLSVDYSKTEAARVAPQPERRRERDRRPERRRDAGEEPREEPAQEPRPRAEPERRVEPEPEPTPPPAPEPEPEPAEPEPAPEPTDPAPAEPEPAPAPAEPAEPSPAEAEPEPEPGTYEKAPAPPPEPEPATPAPEPAPEMQAPPPPAPETPPEPEARATLPPSPMRSTANGTCSDCKPGEAAVSARLRAASRAAGQSCPPAIEEAIQDAIEILAASPVPEAEDYVGPLVDGGRVLPWAETTAVAEAQRLLEPWLTPGSSCQAALVVLSPDVEFTGYRYQAADAQAGGDCLAGQDCPIGEALWRDHPGIERTDAGTFIYSVFENRSSGWERRGELTVYFKP